MQSSRTAGTTSAEEESEAIPRCSRNVCCLVYKRWQEGFKFASVVDFTAEVLHRYLQQHSIPVNSYVHEQLIPLPYLPVTCSAGTQVYGKVAMQRPNRPKNNCKHCTRQAKTNSVPRRLHGKRMAALVSSFEGAPWSKARVRQAAIGHIDLLI